MVQQEIPALRFSRVRNSSIPRPNLSDGAATSIASKACSRSTPPSGTSCKTFPTLADTHYIDDLVTFYPEGQRPTLIGTSGTFAAARACQIRSPIQHAIGVFVILFYSLQFLTALSNVSSCCRHRSVEGEAHRDGSILLIPVFQCIRYFAKSLSICNR